MSPEFATNLRLHRQLKGLTQQDLAAAARISQTLVSQLERGLRPSNNVGLLHRIASALDVPLARLCGHAPRAGSIRPSPAAAESRPSSDLAALAREVSSYTAPSSTAFDLRRSRQRAIGHGS